MRKNTERTNCDEAKAPTHAWESADSWDGPPMVKCAIRRKEHDE